MLLPKARQSFSVSVIYRFYVIEFYRGTTSCTSHSGHPFRLSTAGNILLGCCKDGQIVLDERQPSTTHCFFIDGVLSSFFPGYRIWPHLSWIGRGSGVTLYLLYVYCLL